MEDEARPAIPAELKRRVLIDSGHRCAIPTCKQTEVDLHHIIPWESCRKHEYDNLIALCPNCHRRAHKGEIDRKSLKIYKNNIILKIEHGEVQSGLIDLDIFKGLLHTLKVAGNMKIRTTGWGAGIEKLILILTNGGNHAIEWIGFNSLPFEEGFSFTENGTDIVEITSYDGLICLKLLESGLNLETTIGSAKEI